MVSNKIFFNLINPELKKIEIKTYIILEPVNLWSGHFRFVSEQNLDFLFCLILFFDQIS